jgi:hypothetical protein
VKFARNPTEDTGIIEEGIMYMQPLPRHIKSCDYDELIELALAIKDKEWFLDLTHRKKKLEAAEEEVRRDFGFVD